MSPQAFGRQPIPAVGDVVENPEPVQENGTRVSLLARRLADPEPGADEYLAAATVLAMKYGPAVLDQVNTNTNVINCFLKNYD